jgi:rhodanese-related sulfurtransferase
VQHLEAIGFERVYNLKGGIKGWVKAIDPSLPTY